MASGNEELFDFTRDIETFQFIFASHVGVWEQEIMGISYTDILPPTLIRIKCLLIRFHRC